MDQNGSLGSNSMAAEDSNTSGFNIIEEPAAPRRNSTDDNDSSRPRKRPAVAVMSTSDVRSSPTSESIPTPETDPESPLLAAAGGLQASVCGACPPGDSAAPTNEIKTVQVRAPGEEMGIIKDTPPETSILAEEDDSSASSRPASDNDNDDDVDVDANSTQDVLIEVEEMDSTEDYSSHIRLLDAQPERLRLRDSNGDVTESLTKLALQFERGESPLMELGAITAEIAQFISEVGENVETFPEAYSKDDDLWSKLPNLVEILLKRTDPFVTQFFDANGSLEGLNRITQFLVAYIRYTTLMIRYETSVSPVGRLPEFPTLSRTPLRVLSSLLGPTQLYDAVATSGHSITMHLADVLRCFAEPHGFLHYWKQYTMLLFERIPSTPKLFNFSVFSVALPTSLLRLLDSLSPEVMLQTEWTDLKNSLSSVVSSLVIYVEHTLTELLESNVQVLDVKEFLQYLDHLCTLSQLAYNLDPIPQPLVSRLSKHLPENCPDPKKKELLLLVDCTTRLPTYYKMLASNRMDFRLRGLNRMTETLVKGWRSDAQRNWYESPIIRYLVDFLMHNQVVEYIMGPDSHYELIRRSANIAGFLIVSKTITSAIFDCLWQPALDSRDPRTVQAVLAMHREMIQNMTLDMLVQLCTRVSQIPLTSFDAPVQDFLACLLDRTKGMASARLQNENSTSPLNPAPYELLINLMRAASESDESSTSEENAAPSDLLSFATNELTKLASIGPTSAFRRRTFQECVQDVKEMNGRATGSNIVILSFLKSRPRFQRATSPNYLQDTEYLVHECDLPSLLVKDLESFLDRCDSLNNQTRTHGLQFRLDLLYHLLYEVPNCLPSELQVRLWSCIIDNKSLHPSERDRGFAFYSTFNNTKGVHSILDNAYKSYFPNLDPICFSQKVLDFCLKSLDYLNQAGLPGNTTNAKSESTHINGIEQLWRIIENAPDETLASSASTALVTFYLDSSLLNRLPPPLLESLHIQLVERCIIQLVSAAKVLEKGLHDDLDTEKDLVQVKTRYDRSLNLLDRLVKRYEKRSPQTQVSAQKTHIGVKGQSFEVKMRWHTAEGQSPVHSFKIGSLNTAEDLHKQISQTVGASKHRVILSGQELKLLDEPFKHLKDIGIQKDCFLQVARTPGASEDSFQSSSVNLVQLVTMNHFESLYTLLSLPEVLSAKAWEFLRGFPPHQKIIDEVISEVPGPDMFPRKSPFRFLYSLFAIGYCFSKQRLKQIDVDVPFVRSCVHRLLKALMAGEVSSFGESLITQLTVMNELLRCLNGLLKELQASNRSFPIADADRYINRLVSILDFCHNTATGPVQLLSQCCANAIYLLFESFKISVELWSGAKGDATLLQHLVHKYLVEEQRKNVRSAAREAIISICVENTGVGGSGPQGFADFFWPILDNIISAENANLDYSDSEELFDTVVSVFKFVGDVRGETLDLNDLFSRWFGRLQSCRPSECVGRPAKDYAIFGYTQLLRSCLNFDTNHVVVVTPSFVEDIWCNLLFPGITVYPTNVIERIPCIHEETRTELYNLLEDIAENPPCYTQLIKLNKSLFPKDSLTLEHPGDHKQWLRESTGHVGLQNLSNTCYLNSLLTQLFMNVGFRSFVFQLPIAASDTSRKITYHLQGLFARMQYSFSKAIEPKDFVDSLQDFAGDPIDPTVQMDVDEFFNLLFDRLESEMPSAESKSAFRSYYGGQLVQQVKSNECAHISERTEPFSAIQCDIKGKSSLQESLKAYVEGEIMEGDNKYRCTMCDKLVDAVKRTCLKDIPDNLILHLKRFEFDLQTMHRSKINDTFDFPTELDMAPYTINHLSAKEAGNDGTPVADMFELVGVLVHTGTAESGHYYSYIRDRISTTPSWYEFNDSNVREFDPETIPSACYGGSDGLNTSGNYIDKAFSAYMLFYQRSSSLQHSQAHTLATAEPITAPVPDDLRGEIVIENESLLRRYCMFGGNYIDFIRHLLEIPFRCSELSMDDRLRVLTLALTTFEQIASKYKELMQWDKLVSSLRDCILGNVLCCAKFIKWASREDIITSMILTNPFMRVRQTFTKMVLDALHYLRAQDQNLYYGATDRRQSLDTDESLIVRLCLGFVHTWGGLQWSLKPWNDFLGTLVDIALLGPQERETLLEVGVLAKVLETIVADHLPPSEKARLRFENFGKIWVKIRNQAGKLALLLSSLLEICSPFLRVCHEGERYQDQEYPLPLTFWENRLLLYSADKYSFFVFARLLDCNGTVQNIGSIVEHILSSTYAPTEHPLLEKLEFTLLSGVCMDPAISAWPYLQCLQVFVANTRSEKYVSNIIRKVAAEVPTIGMSGGPEHLLFFERLFELEDQNRPVRFYLVQNVRLWVPPLLVYCEEAVRNSAEELLDRLLLTPFEESPNPITQRAVLTLATGCFDFVQNNLAKNHQPCEEKTFENLFRVLDRIGEAHPDEEQWRSSIDALKASVDRLILEENDVDINSDWACSETASELQEITVHSEGYSL